MSTCKVFVPYGALGVGISDEAFDGGIKLGPDIIACDAGSTDSGPYYLGTGRGKYARESVKEDFRRMMVAGHTLGVPVAVGSCGTCGSNQGVDDAAEICAEICAEAGFSAKIAKIYTQQDPSVLKAKFREGKITPLEAAPEITEKTFDECSTIVALAGAEPFIKALEQGADIVLCGRATDTAIIAAMPLLKGCDPATAWHAAKISECGPLCCVDPWGGLFLSFDTKSVIIESTAPGNSCTTFSTSAHMLYENSNPISLTEPGVIVDVANVVYEEIGNGRVKLSGAVLKKMPYTMKLEGSSPSGYQTVSVVGIADHRIMKDPFKWLNKMEAQVRKQLEKIGLMSGYSYAFKAYGVNAVTGEEFKAGSFVPKEIGLILVVTAETQSLATRVAKVFNPLLLHCGVNDDEPMPSFAFPFSPTETEKGLIYEFRLNHIVHISDPLELVRMEFVELSKGGK
jgi:hypothetical protein